MIRNTLISTVLFLAVTSCAKNKDITNTQTYTPAQFEVSDVYVNMADGIENSNRIRAFMKNAGINTANVYNYTMVSADTGYPLEIEVNEVSYRNPDALAASDKGTYIKFTATLREEASGEVFRSLPVTYYHAWTGTLTSSEAKQDAEKNMIEISIKNAFSKLYGMENIPQNIQTHFDVNDIFADPNTVVVRLDAEEVAEISTSEATVANTSAGNKPTVIKCAVC